MKIKTKIFHLNLSLFVALIFTSGCYYDKVLPVEPEGEISYTTDMQPFFDAKCISCHNGGGVPLDLTAGISYDALFAGNYINTSDPASSTLYTKIDTGGSMESYATDVERATTLKWIEQGANNN